MTIQLSNSFTVPTPVAETWRTLLDVERVALCLPGAQLESMDGDTFTGRVKVKLGPIAMSFKGSAEFVEKDEDGHRALLAANGREVAGSGTASAVMTMRVVESASGVGSTVTVDTELAITGKAAKFGRGVIPDVAGRLVDQFATSLTASLVGATTGAATAAESSAGNAAGPGPATPDPVRADDAFQLLGGGSGASVRRLGVPPERALWTALLVLVWLHGRRRGSEACRG